MSRERIEAEGQVSANQENIPARIRRELNIEDGDHLRWILDEEGQVRVQVVQRQTMTFGGFEGYDGTRETDVASEHDMWGFE